MRMRLGAPLLAALVGLLGLAQYAAASHCGADNYACDQGICKYTGCTSTAECQTTFGTTRPYVCANGTCQLRCNSSADCALPSGGAYAADRYQCTNNVCVWLGCNSDASCQQTFQSPNYACR